MGLTSKTKDKTTTAGKRLARALKKLNKQPEVKAGIIQNKFTAPHKKSPETVGEIALANEFGSDTNPERSFIRSTADKQQKAWLRLTDGLRKKVMSGKITEAQALAQLGLKMQSDIQATITKLKNPPNSQRTIDRKGSSNPLIDTGQMHQAVSFEVLPKRKR